MKGAQERVLGEVFGVCRVPAEVIGETVDRLSFTQCGSFKAFLLAIPRCYASPSKRTRRKSSSDAWPIMKVGGYSCQEGFPSASGSASPRPRCASRFAPPQGFVPSSSELRMRRGGRQRRSFMLSSEGNLRYPADRNGAPIGPGAWCSSKPHAAPTRGPSSAERQRPAVASCSARRCRSTRAPLAGGAGCALEVGVFRTYRSRQE